MNDKNGLKHENERGIALITTLMVTTMLLALGMAVVMSATTDTTINRSHRLGEQAFFAADGGLAVARRALATAIQEELDDIQSGAAGNAGFWRFNSPAGNYQVIPDPILDPNHAFYVNVRARALALTRSTARDATLDALNGASFTVSTIALNGGEVIPVAVPFVSGSPERATLRYTIVVDGQTSSGARASVTETARITTRMVLTNVAGVPPTPRAFKFSGFGAFFDVGDQGGGSALAAGTFSGPAHSNTKFAFNPNSLVKFTSSVSQFDNQIRLNGVATNRPTADTTWIDIPASGYEQKPKVPLPANNFSQEYAVINGTGITATNPDGTPVDAPPVSVPTVLDAGGRVTKEALQANLRGVAAVSGSGVNFNAAPEYINAGGTLTTSAAAGISLAPGVYISANATTVTGAGIYVQGDAFDIQLVPGLLATDQKYVIKQERFGSGSSQMTTTITVSPTTNTTTVQRGTDLPRVYVGTPTDRSDPANPTKGTSLFVNGSIKSLRGGVTGSTAATTKPALATDSMLTITAQRDITITGDLKYTNQVADPTTGLPVPNANLIKNVLGLFTNDGNVQMEPNGTYVASSTLSLQMDAAVVSFNSNTGNDSGRKASNGGTSSTDGSIVFTGTTSALDSNDKWTLIGSRVQANINNIGFPKRNIFFDTRFDGGKFSPPFWPGTDYVLGQPGVTAGVVAIATVDAPTPSGVSWYRKSR